MSHAAMKWILVFALSLASSTVSAGSIRYELPALLGQHTYTVEPAGTFVSEHVYTPYNSYQVDQARLVVEGHVSAGLAHGDGIWRENTSFELLPSVGVFTSFENQINILDEPTPEDFRIETVWEDPFWPEVTPLPNPGGDPPQSFSVYLRVGPVFGTAYPPLLDPPDGFVLSTSGIVIDTPIVAHIDTAYIVLSGASIVPEPSGIALASVLAVLAWGLGPIRQAAKRE
ncbi:hypothetical protein NG895_14180 [Aeoliella sp. ICT_H6.2]|uniref:PEP-CTERM sorting domain-containing protein n=1 Tax=Aeoliella straminimaris TaxID=2954799 RepID=A0A9X2FAQ4_9BACT|nr:hypothetical protein [Aeoliella straminimaris]MCO6045054.1 hypothetical protein [Aeoliella straminimaris]